MTPRKSPIAETQENLNKPLFSHLKSLMVTTVQPLWEALMQPGPADPSGSWPGTFQIHRPPAMIQKAPFAKE